MRVEDAIAITEQLISTRLTEIQRTILIKAWEGQSYIQIAQLLAYNEGYVKSVGADLWQLLSDAIGERVSKHNFREILTRTTSATTTIAPAIYHSTSESVPLPIVRRRDWYEMVDVSEFYGRDRELTTLTEWIVQDRCRLVTIAGSGGIGKTTLAARLVQQLHSQYECVVWRSLLHAPSLDDLLVTLLQSTVLEQDIPAQVNERFSRLFHHLRQSSCLVVLDNFESILQGQTLAGQYRPGYENYADLLQLFGNIPHQSTVLLTSREMPNEVVLMEGPDLRVRSFILKGVQTNACQAILKRKGIPDQESTQSQLVHYYQGNPLALKIVATTICELFNGDVSLFLKQGTSLCSGIRILLEHQFNRLSDLERHIMYWFAINRDATTLEELQNSFATGASNSKLLQSLESLYRRSLIERNAVRYTQQPVVMEYVTEHLIDQVCREILSGEFVIFRSCALIKAGASDQIQDIQRHLIVQPLIDRLINQLRSPRNVIRHFKQLLSTQREQTPLQARYTNSNIVNLLQIIQHGQCCRQLRERENSVMLNT